MTATELKDYISLKLAVPLNLVSKLKDALFAMVDFTTSSVTTIIPDWTNAITFSTTGPNIYCTYLDTDGNKKLWQTKTDGNIGNQPPTAPATHEDTFWLEVSASASAAIPEWTPGLYGPGLIIVYHNHSVDGKGLYVLNEPARPYNSANIETEITALKWELISGGSGGGGGTVVSVTGSVVDNTDPTNPVINADAAGSAAAVQSALLDSVPTPGNTLNKLYNLIVAVGQLVGGWNTSALPTTGTGASSAIDKGDYWRITGTITIAGIGDLKAGDMLIASVANASVAADFFAVQNNVDLATNTVLGIVKLYTDLLASNTDGSPTQAAVVAGLALKEDAANKANSFATLNNTLFPSVQAVANELLYLNNIVAVTGAAGTDASIKAATALDRIPTTGAGSVATGRYVQFIVADIKYTACLKAGTLAEAAPFIVRANDYATTTNEKYWELTREFNSIYLPNITGYLGATGSDNSMWQATAIDRIPTTGLTVGTRINAIVTISGTQRRLYTAELVTPVDSTAAIELSPSVIRGNDFNASTNNKVWREIRQNGIIDVSNFGVVPDPTVFVSDQIIAIMTAATAGDTLWFPPGAYKIFAINVTKYLHFVGYGAKFIFSTVNTQHFTINQDLVSVRGFTFVGQGRSNATYPLQGALKIANCSNVMITDCWFDAMPYYCIQTNATHVSDTSGDFGGIAITHCHMMRSKIGLYAATRGEYIDLTGTVVTDCDTGTLIGAGNVNVTGGQITDSSVVAVDLVTDVNDGHGIFTGTQINHNVLSVRGVSIVNGHFFRGCNIYYGDMQFTSCVGIVFTDCAIEGLEMKFDGCSGCKIENAIIPGIGGNCILTTNWNGNQSDVFAFNNKNHSNKLVPSWNQSPLLSLYQETSTAAINHVAAKVLLAASEVIVIKGFVLAVRVDLSPDDYTEAYYQPFEVVFRRRAGGNIIKVGETLGTVIKDGAFGGSINLNANTTDQTFDLEVVPDADDTLWTIQFAYTKSSLIPGLKV